VPGSVPRRKGPASYRLDTTLDLGSQAWSAKGQAIGIEITAPAKISLAALNAVLKELGQAPASAADLAPVLAA
jgi:hypothetical protein